MSKQPIDLDIEILKPNPLIEQTQKLTFLQMKMINVLLHNALDKLEYGAWQKISLNKLYELVKYESHNAAYVKEAAKELMSRVVEWDCLEDGEPVWEATAYLANAKVQGGYLYYKYSDSLIKLFSLKSSFTLLDLAIQTNFKGKYSLAIWELCQRYKNTPTKPGFPKSTGFIEIKKLRAFLGLEDDEYVKFKDLNTYIIKKSLIELNAKSDLLIDVEYHRDGKKINEIKFLITVKTDIKESIKTSTETRKPNPLPNTTPIQKTEPEPQIDQELTKQKSKDFFEKYKNVDPNPTPQKGLSKKELEELEKTRKEQNGNTAQNP